MKGLIHAYRNYLTQDGDYILENNLSEKELRKLNRSSWLHQLTLAPLDAFLMLGSAFTFYGENYPYGVLYGAMAFSTHSVYLRYGMRRLFTSRKIKQLKNCTEQKS